MENRGKSSREIWKARIEAQSRSGLTHKAFCTEAGIAVSAFRYWKSRLNKESGSRPELVEVSTAVINELPVSGPGTGLSLELPSGIRLGVNVDTDLELLRRVIACLVPAR